MRFVAISGYRHILRRRRHLRRRDVAQFKIWPEETPVAGCEANAQAGQTRALGERVEDDDIGEIRSGSFQHPRGSVPAVDFAVALIGEHEEAETARQLYQLGEVAAIGDGS